MAKAGKKIAGALSYFGGFKSTATTTQVKKPDPNS